MDVHASYDEGHLVVAAIRVLTHRHSGRPPTAKDVAEELGLSQEWSGVLLRSLEKASVVRAHTGPYETRYEVADHLALEKLPKKDSAAGVDEELKEFSKQKREEEEKLKNLFASGDALKKQQEKMGKLADEMKRWKPKGPKSSPFFKDSDED